MRAHRRAWLRRSVAGASVFRRAVKVTVTCGVTSRYSGAPQGKRSSSAKVAGTGAVYIHAACTCHGTGSVTVS